jgi:hypothetical protein
MYMLYLYNGILTVFVKNTFNIQKCVFKRMRLLTTTNLPPSFFFFPSSFQTVGCRIAVQYKEHGLLRDKVAAVVLQV